MVNLRPRPEFLFDKLPPETVRMIVGLLGVRDVIALSDASPRLKRMLHGGPLLDVVNWDIDPTTSRRLTETRMFMSRHKECLKHGRVTNKALADDDEARRSRDVTTTTTTTVADEGVQHQDESQLITTNSNDGEARASVERLANLCRGVRLDALMINAFVGLDFLTSLHLRGIRLSTRLEALCCLKNLRTLVFVECDFGNALPHPAYVAWDRGNFHGSPTISLPVKELHIIRCLNVYSLEPVAWCMPLLEVLVLRHQPHTPETRRRWRYAHGGFPCLKILDISHSFVSPCFWASLAHPWSEVFGFAPSGPLWREKGNAWGLQELYVEQVRNQLPANCIRFKDLRVLSFAGSTRYVRENFLRVLGRRCVSLPVLEKLNLTGTNIVDPGVEQQFRQYFPLTHVDCSTELRPSERSFHLYGE